MGAEETIVIRKQDLKSPYIEDMILQEKAAKKELTRIETKPVKTALWLNPVFYTAAAGAFGAVFCWFFLEPEYHAFYSYEVLLKIMIYVIPGFIGMSISAIDGIVSRNWSRALKCGTIGLGVSTILGYVFSEIANSFMRNLLRFLFIFFPYAVPSSGSRIAQFPMLGLYFLTFTRTIAWPIVGISMGVGPGIAMKSKKLFYNGIIGGLLGGFMGGFLFDPICVLLDIIGIDGQGAASRVIGFCCVGILTGIFTGIIESISKEAWVKMITGALRGKNFILYHDATVVGSSPRCDIYIFKDPKVEPVHAEIRKKGSKYEISSNGKFPIYVNGKQLPKKFLDEGDLITIGESTLEFHQKDRS